MAYSIDRARLVADQLERFAHSHAHQLAGQVANLGFWLDEVAAALRTMDEYPQRFRRLRESQASWVKRHGTVVSEYCPHCGGACEFGPHAPPPPTRIPSEQLGEARDRIRQSCYRFLLRSYRLGLLEEPAVREACERVGVGVEAEDLEREPVQTP